MFEILKTDFEISEEIGCGKFGTIYRCISKLTGQSFACKTIQKTLLLDSTDRECLNKEPKILQLLSGNSNILQIYKVYEDDNYLHIVTELCSSDDLYDRLSNGLFSEKDAAVILRQLVSAINYCHKMGVAHRDIKPDNILFDSQDNLKLADFGYAEWFLGNEKKTMRGLVGTPYYVAPEVLLGREYNEKVDIWSAGAMLYIMLSGVAPFCGDTTKEIFEAVLRGNLRFPTRIFGSVSTEVKDLLRKMICKDVSRRFSAEQVLRHPWIINGGETRSTADSRN
ncbi:phosphoenolpyruvate carboxylase kinase 2-like [Nicotiana sylvestris]|uniref:Phosphoenolpyruvate carboxylase kinase 2-like n=1 Tax=Nicotiana sylvestris TaxID=4096 RepID=A0A1U7Y869_NICSY|nr:PREDICTED: phosphoenolpyruvate carboxylase kinase 2-like [Nicotiana sylvestris]